MPHQVFLIAILSAVLCTAASATPRVYKYECHYLGHDGGGSSEFILKLAGPRAQITRDGDKYEGRLDRDYKPRTNTSYLRYEGWKDLNSEWQAWLLIEKSLLEGGRELKNGTLGGVVKIQARGESYEGQRYGCTSLKAK